MQSPSGASSCRRQGNECPEQDFGNQQAGRGDKPLPGLRPSCHCREELKVLKDRQKLEEAAKREANQPDTGLTDAEQKRLALQRLNAEIRADLEAQLNLLDKYETKGTFNYDILVAQAEAYAQIRQVNASVNDELTRQSKIREILNLLDRESRLSNRVCRGRPDALQARNQLINDIANQQTKTQRRGRKSQKSPRPSTRVRRCQPSGQRAFRITENLIFATKNWTDVLTGALKALSSLLIKFALGGLANGDGRACSRSSTQPVTELRSPTSTTH